mgnify:CR=1 FL=1
MDLLRSWLRGQAHDEKAHAHAYDGGGGVIKEAPMVIDGRCLTIDEFVDHVDALTFPLGLPNRIFLHHTWRPTRETWNGLSTILGMKAYYERQRWVDEQGRWHEGWTAGPHVFVADDGIWLFSDLNYDGVGVAGHNRDSLHIEMVGNFDAALPDGPMWTNTVAVLGALHERIGLPPEKLNFHRDFSTKTCPGLQVQKAWVIPQVQQWVAEFRARRHTSVAGLRRKLRELAGEALLPATRGTALADAARERGLLGPLMKEVPIEVDGQAYVVQFFAEALLVPVNQWEQVLSLAEFEQQPRHDEVSLAASHDSNMPIYDVTTAPGDVISTDRLH